eukprot:SAG31_NODE_14_length_37953_cov_109.719660_27_plen_647_part_00
MVLDLMGVADVSRRAAGSPRGIGGLRLTFCVLCCLSAALPGHGRRRDGQRNVGPHVSAAEAGTLLGTVQVDRDDAQQLLALANQELLKLQYANATRLYRLSAAAHPTPLSVRSLQLMVEAGRGLLQCGEVKLAGQVLKYSVQAAPPPRKQSAESSQALTLALAALARVYVSDSTHSTAAKVAAIEAAAKAQPPPNLNWSLWAVNALKFALGDSSRAATVLKKGVLDAPIGSLDLTLPSLAQKLRWLLRRLRKAATQRESASRSLQAIEARLHEEHDLWAEHISRAATSVDVPIGSQGDVWRALDMSAPLPTQFFQHTTPVSGDGDGGVGNGNGMQVATGDSPSQLLVLTPLTTSPVGYVVDGFASAEECEALVKLARGHLHRSTVGRSQADEIRTSSSAERKSPPHLELVVGCSCGYPCAYRFSSARLQCVSFRFCVHNVDQSAVLQLHMDQPVVRQLLQRAGSLVGIPGVLPSDFELQVVQYKEDEQYKFHYDTELGQQSIENDIVRYLTMFLYLSDVEVGGETVLPLALGANATTESNNLQCGSGCELQMGATVNTRATGCYACIEANGRGAAIEADCSNPSNPGATVQPKIGRMVFWYNYHQNGTFHGRSMHAGCPVLVGEKLGANIWLDGKGGQPMLARVAA